MFLYVNNDFCSTSRTFFFAQMTYEWIVLFRSFQHEEELGLFEPIRIVLNA
jgi:hypothetical protein